MLKRFLNNRSGFARNIIALVSATALAQVINFGFNILLTRLYSPTDFGVLSVFMSLVSFVVVASAGKYDIALVAAPDREDAQGLVSAGLYITICVALLALIGVWMIYFIPISFYNTNPVHKWFYIIPLSVILLSSFQVLWMWNVREKRFKNISFIRPLEALVNNTLCIILKGYNELGLIAGAITGQFVSFTIISGISLKKDGRKLFATPFKKIKAAALRYSEFPRVNILQGFVETLQMGLIVLVASNYFLPDEIGFYALCMRVLQAPSRLVTLPLAHVFFAEASQKYREGHSLHALVKRITYQAGKWLIAMPVVLILAGPFLFKAIFGPQWGEAGVYAAILSPWIFLDMLRGPVVQVASIIGKQKKILFISLIANAVLLVSLIFGIWYGLRFRSLLILISATQSLMSLYIINVIFKMARINRYGGTE